MAIRGVGGRRRVLGARLPLPGDERNCREVYRITAVAVDIQVALGLVVWIVNSGWALGFTQGWLHPILGLAALGALHTFIARARRGPPETANRKVRTGLMIATVFVVAAIGIAEMA